MALQGKGDRQERQPHGEDRYTTRESERLLRLPMYYGLELEQVDYICGKLREFYR